MVITDGKLSNLERTSCCSCTYGVYSLDRNGGRRKLTSFAEDNTAPARSTGSRSEFVFVRGCAGHVEARGRVERVHDVTQQPEQCCNAMNVVRGFSIGRVRKGIILKFGEQYN
jgi:hypothetical protein